jgi:protease I
VNQPLQSKRILMFVGDIYEDLELWYPKLRMIEAGAEVVVAGPEAGRTYAGKNGYPCPSDAAIADVAADTFDGLIVPGGFMPDKLRRDPQVLDLVRGFDAAGKLVAAICHGGWIPISAGVYRQVRVTGLAGHQGRSDQRRRAVGGRSGGDRPPLRQQPQAGRSARLLPRHPASHGWPLRLESSPARCAHRARIFVYRQAEGDCVAFE